MEADRDAVPVGLAFQLQSTTALAHDKGPTPFCGPIKKANEPPPYVLSLDNEKFASRVLCQLPAHYVPEARLQQNVQDRDFPSRRVRKKPPQADVDEFKAKCSELRRLATAQELSNPVSFALENSETTTLKSDKQHFLEHTPYDEILSPFFAFSLTPPFFVLTFGHLSSRLSGWLSVL